MNVYADYNFLIHCAKEPTWRKAVLEAHQSGKISVVLSAWHFYEYGNGSGHPETEALIQFAEELQPKWILERGDLQHQEFIAHWNCIWGGAPLVFNPVCTLAQAGATLNRVPVERMSRYTIREYIQSFSAPGALDKIRAELKNQTNVAKYNLEKYVNDKRFDAVLPVTVLFYVAVQLARLHEIEREKVYALANLMLSQEALSTQIQCFVYWQCAEYLNGHSEASCLFWTLGGRQVGKAALIGWIDVLVRAVQNDSARIWPFDGDIESLLHSERVVVAETYPAEFYKWFAAERPRSKMDIECRKMFGRVLLDWASCHEIAIEQKLKIAIESGFPEGKDDAFDAVVGLFGILQICLGERVLYEPEDKAARNIEGWILGRRSRPVERASIQHSAATDPEIRDWLRWATKDGEARTFIHLIAEAALVADSKDYALLRPVLLELSRSSR